MAKVTLKQIAQECGVSVSTVSLALRDHARIPESTKTRIKTTAMRLGYAPNRSVARVMREIRSSSTIPYKETLGYLTADPQDYEKRIYAGVQKRAARIGYGLNRFVIEDFKRDVGTLSRVTKARGIRGLIIAPFPYAEASLKLPWERLAGVSIGYTLAHPGLSRVARDLVHSMRSVFMQLTDRGYGRIGFLMEHSHEERMDFSNLAGFLLHEWQITEQDRVPPLVKNKLSKSILADWVKSHRPEAIITMYHPALKWLQEMQIRVPEDIAFFVFNAHAPDSVISGIYPNYEEIGAKAVDQVTGLLERSDFGVQPHPSTLLVPGVWCEGQTIRTKVFT